MNQNKDIKANTSGAPSGQNSAEAALSAGVADCWGSAAVDAAGTDTGPFSTSSRNTNLFGLLILAGFIAVFLLAFFVVEADRVQGDVVRLMFVHVPVAVVPYLAFGITAIGSIAVLLKRSQWWDVVASSSAEIGVLFGALTLITGSIWGRPTWNTWWEWGDVRLMTSLVLFLMFAGYLAYRRSMTDTEIRARRSAVLALIATLNLVLVNRSVEWWQNRTLHQQSTLAEGRMENMTLFTLMLAIVVFMSLFGWLLVQRFRLGWLAHQIETLGLEAQIAQRRQQAASGYREAVTQLQPGQSQSGQSQSGRVEK